MLKGLPTIDGRPGSQMSPLDFASLKTQLLEDHGPRINDYDALSSAMYPKVGVKAQKGSVHACCSYWIITKWIMVKQNVA